MFSEIDTHCYFGTFGVLPYTGTRWKAIYSHSFVSFCTLGPHRGKEENVSVRGRIKSKNPHLVTVNYPVLWNASRIGISVSFDRVEKDGGAGRVSIELESIQSAVQRRAQRRSAVLLATGLSVCLQI